MAAPVPPTPKPASMEEHYALLKITPFHNINKADASYSAQIKELQSRAEAFAFDSDEIEAIRKKRIALKNAYTAVNERFQKDGHIPEELQYSTLANMPSYKVGFRDRESVGGDYVYREVNQKSGETRGIQGKRILSFPLGLIALHQNVDITDPNKQKSMGYTLSLFNNSIYGPKFHFKSAAYKAQQKAQKAPQKPSVIAQTVKNFLYKKDSKVNPQDARLPNDLSQRALNGYGYNQTVAVRMNADKSIKAQNVVAKTALNQIKESHIHAVHQRTGAQMKAQDLEMGRMGLSRINDTKVGKFLHTKLPDLTLFRTNVETLTEAKPGATTDRKYELSIGKAGNFNLFKRNVESVTDTAGKKVGDPKVSYEVLGFKNKIMGIPLHK